VTTSETSEPLRRATPVQITPRPGATLVTALLGFFVVTLDAVIVNVALPPIRADLGGGIRGLQWVGPHPRLTTHSTKGNLS
jgi:MFS transporter, DHA2 family, methylenomycin A resistance protein